MGMMSIEFSYYMSYLGEGVVVVVRMGAHQYVYVGGGNMIIDIQNYLYTLQKTDNCQLY